MCYQAKFYQLLKYIEQHLDQSLSLEQLSQQANCSKFHFHRQFSAFLGMPCTRYILLKRLKRSAHQLAFRNQMKIIDIALQAGFESPEAFARAFKRLTSLSPSQFRKMPSWTAFEEQAPTTRIKQMILSPPPSVQINNFPATNLAVLEHRGDPAGVYNSVQKFIAWRKLYGPSPKQSRTFNILYDDPETTEPELYRFDIAASIKGELEPNSDSIIQKTIPSGRCAVLRVQGSSEKMAQSIRWLFEQWLPQSGDTLRDFPLYVERLSIFPDVAEHNMFSDVYLPLA